MFEKRIKYVGNDVDIVETAKICGKWLKYLRTGFKSMLQMTLKS